MDTQNGEVCQVCGIANSYLTQYTIRTNFAFGKNFPAEYQDLLLCQNCIDNYEQKNKKLKVMAVLALVVIITFMGINFVILISPAL